MKPRPLFHLILGTGLLLGLGIPLARLAAGEGISPLTFSFWPTLAAGLALSLVAWQRHGAPVITGRLVRFGAVTGIVGHAIPVSSAFWLASHAGASFPSLTFTLPPVFTLLVSLLVGFERLDWRRAAAVALGLVGALLIVTGRGGSFEVTGMAAAVAVLIPTSVAAANVFWAAHLPRAMSAEWLGAMMMLWSAVALAAIGGFRGGPAVPVTGPALLWPGIQAEAMTAGNLLCFVLQKRAEPVVFSFIGYDMMLTGVALVPPAFGEQLPPAIWPGLMLDASAVWLVNRLPARHGRPAANRRTPVAPVSKYGGCESCRWTRCRQPSAFSFERP